GVLATLAGPASWRGCRPRRESACEAPAPEKWVSLLDGIAPCGVYPMERYGGRIEPGMRCPCPVGVRESGCCRLRRGRRRRPYAVVPAPQAVRRRLPFARLFSPHLVAGSGDSPTRAARGPITGPPGHGWGKPPRGPATGTRPEGG